MNALSICGVDECTIHQCDDFQPPTHYREEVSSFAITQSREEELKVRKVMKVYSAALMTVSRIVPIIVSLVGFGLYEWAFPGKLTAGKIFTSLTWFGILQAPLIFFPIMVNFVGQFVASVKRAETFLIAPDRERGKQPPKIPVEGG